MRILFCNIARMKYYKGVLPGIDEPKHGGEYVSRTGDAAEKYNFAPLQTEFGERCFGFVETKSTNSRTTNQLHIERLEGVAKRAEEANDVLVVWCSTHHQNRAVVVGWYKHATVLRNYETIEVKDETGVSEQIFNVEADAQDCVLLPEGERNRHCWWAPRKKMTRSFGFGQANVWFAEEESAGNYVRQLVEQIEGYQGESWLHYLPDDLMGE